MFIVLSSQPSRVLCSLDEVTVVIHISWLLEEVTQCILLQRAKVYKNQIASKIITENLRLLQGYFTTLQGPHRLGFLLPKE